MNLADDPTYLRISNGSVVTLESFASMLKRAEMDIANPIDVWFEQIKKIARVLQTELTYLRTMEAHVREGTMTEEIWEGIVTELTAFRNKTVIEAGGTVGNSQETH